MEAANDAEESLRAQVGEAEWAQRVDLAAAYRLAAQFGWDELIFTHFTARVPGPEQHFLINPFGLLFEEITASALVKIDRAGEKVLETDYPVNPAGFTLHSAIHEAREDAHCVLHLHTVAGTAVASQAEGLLPLTQNALVVTGDLAYHAYEGLALEEGEKARIAADLGAKNTMLLKNHGLLALGETMAEAFLRLYFLQRACEMQVAAQAGGSELILQGGNMAERVAGQAASGFEQAGALTWAALKRKLERSDTGYRE